MRKSFRTFLISQLFLLGADQYGSWPSKMWGLPSLPHTPGAPLSFTPAIPALANRIPLSAVSLQCRSVSEASPGGSVSGLSAPAPWIFSFYSLFLLAALGLGCCTWDLQYGMQDLVPRPGNEPGPLHWEQT